MFVPWTWLGVARMSPAGAADGATGPAEDDEQALSYAILVPNYTMLALNVADKVKRRSKCHVADTCCRNTIPVSRHCDGF